ncbi:MAG: hypothetical protein QNJ37_20730 [Crocosphaera sp.]|nr:hypothetical protein [Crocosphaera sp.]
MNFNQIGTYYEEFSSLGFAEDSYFLIRLTNLWGEDCLELAQEEELSSE